METVNQRYADAKMANNTELLSSYSEQGFSWPVKTALLERFGKMKPSASFIESLKLGPQVLADIWLPVPFPPVSMEPLSEEELRSARLGSFCASNRYRTDQNQGAGSGVAGGYSQRRDGRFQGHNQQQQQPGGMKPSQLQQRQQGQQGQQGRFPAQGQQTGRRREDEQFDFRAGGRDRFHAEEEEAIEDPDSLWSFPTSNTMDSAAAFGSFDENGVFRSGTLLKELSLEEDAPIEKTPSLFSSPSLPAAQPAAAVAVAQAPVKPPASLPTITPETNWFYRDPSGHIQGPFQSSRMLEWYNGGYFPESLPLRREQDVFFEPLSTWKIKCGGQIPFAAYSAPQLSSSPSSVVDDLFASRSPRMPELTAPVVPNPVPTGTTASSVPTTRSVAIESIFGASRPAASPEPAVQMPSSSPKRNEKSVQQLEQELTKIAFTVAGPGVSSKPAESAPGPVDAEQAATKSWSKPSGQVAKPVSLAEIMKQQDAIEAVPLKPAAVEPEIVGGNGWAKLPSSSTSLADIIQAEALKAKVAPAESVHVASGPKSFADLVRAAGQVGGSIVVTNQAQQPVAASAVAAPAIKAADLEQYSIKSASRAPEPAVETLDKWCLQALKQSPLSKEIDPDTCCALLMDLSSASAILSFSIETLYPLLPANSAFDLAGFASELATKKFGKAASANVNWSRLTAASGSPATALKSSTSADFSFETVRRKKK